jgi:hypothetical protein
MYSAVNFKTIGKIIVIMSGICFISCKDDEPRSLKKNIEAHMAEY